MNTMPVPTTYVAPVQRRATAHRTRAAQPSSVAVALVTMAAVLGTTAFWASISWLLWGTTAATITAVVVTVGMVLVIGLLRSASDSSVEEDSGQEVLLDRRDSEMSAMNSLI